MSFMCSLIFRFGAPEGTVLVSVLFGIGEWNARMSNNTN